MVPVGVLADQIVIVGVAPGDPSGRAGGPAPFRTIRGRVVSADDSSAPVRRVRIILSGAGVTATPAFIDADGRFEIPVPQGSAFALHLTKPVEPERLQALMTRLQIGKAGS